ncbi:YqgQ family protein [Virgibacillus halodenitrificans]|uniref:YqgQ family protein n=1 Tax=Virgibacillus halodenitrificans TaxID=1482 RepID=UPI0009857FA1|nr:YqgQ family protein [Virgibacillus halodenitrificans]
MKSMYDIRQLLKKFGTYIYTGNKMGDLELMEMEIEELQQYGFIQKEDYISAMLLLRKEMAIIRDQKAREGESK